MEGVFHHVLIDGLRQPDGAGEHRPVTSPVEKGAYPLVHVLVNEKP